MKLGIIAAAVTAAALPVLAQTTTAPVETRQARVEVADPVAGDTATASKKASKPAKSTKTAKKGTKKKASKKKPQSVG